MVDGNNAREGRVEMCYDNVYGTVCDDQWGPLDAAVACRQLGFSDAGMLFIVPLDCATLMEILKSTVCILSGNMLFSVT